MSERSSDELLEGLKHRDFVVLAMHGVGENPRRLRNLWVLSRGPVYVGRAEARLVKRGLLVVDGRRRQVTADGKRALKTGAAVLELDAFVP